MQTKPFKKCCAEHIKSIWIFFGNPMEIVHMTTHCPKCKHFIGLTQTPKKEANQFLKKYGVSEL